VVGGIHVRLQGIAAPEMAHFGHPGEAGGAEARDYLKALGEWRPYREDELVGRTLQVGERLRLAVLERDPRRKMITLDPDTGWEEARTASCRQGARRHGRGLRGGAGRGSGAQGRPDLVGVSARALVEDSRLGRLRARGGAWRPSRPRPGCRRRWRRNRSRSRACARLWW
jgi:hypothetical protein